ncbi:two-component system response regulator YesN [Paenibacillus sp. DS2015]|uniref:response regulator transcription factor n=1 Tax=Paenibacillus sp. DS2015 TaxID=3373917 RepID=UPI003D235D4F
MKVIIIDDEPIVCIGLRKLIPWEAYGFEWLGTADNGVKALALIEAKRPDLIILDCQMPLMDGLQLLRELAARQIHLKSIILSSYDEFTYAQQALQLGASDYLLKPPDLDRFTEVILRVKEEWEMENVLKIQMKENFPVMVERFLHSLIHGAKQKQGVFREKTEYLKLQIHSGPFRVCLLEIEDEVGKLDRYSVEDHHLIHFAIGNTIEETLEAWDAKVLFQEQSRRFIMMFNIDSEDQITHIRALLQQLIVNLQTTLRLGATIGVSRHYASLLDDSKMAYENAKIALQYKYYTGANQIIVMDDLEGEQDCVTMTKDKHPLEDEDLIMSIRVCNESRLIAWLASFISFLKNQAFNQHETKMLSLQQMMAATHTMVEMHPQLQLDELLTTKDIEWIFNANTIDELSQLMHRFLFKLFALTQDLRKSGKNVVIEKTKAYIRENYQHNITLEAIATEVFLSPVYLSFLFKQVESMNITDYITHVRIEHAKSLLIKTIKKTYEIANLVGYQDDKYFSRIFKKRVGMTPSEYRMQI